MYRWLAKVLGTILRLCERPAPGARALLKRRRSSSTLFSTTVDTDEIPAKRPRLGSPKRAASGTGPSLGPPLPRSTSLATTRRDTLSTSVTQSTFDNIGLKGSSIGGRDPIQSSWPHPPLSKWTELQFGYTPPTLRPLLHLHTPINAPNGAYTAPKIL